MGEHATECESESGCRHYVRSERAGFDGHEHYGYCVCRSEYGYRHGGEFRDEYAVGNGRDSGGGFCLSVFCV